MLLSTFIAYTGFTACLILAAIVLFRNPRERLNRLFFLMSVSMCFILLLAHFSYTAGTKAMVEFHYKMASFFVGFYFAFNLHFILIFTERHIPKWALFPLYIPALVVIATTFLNYSLFSDFIQSADGTWEFVPAYGTFGFSFYIVYSIATLTLSIIFIADFKKKTTSNKKKHQALIMLSAYLFMVLAGPTLAFLLPLFGIYHLSIYNTNTTIVYLAAVYYAVFKLNFLKLTPSIGADEIINNISNIVIVLDTELIISSVNRQGRKRLGIKTDSQGNMSLRDLSPEGKNIDTIFRDLERSGDKRLFCRLQFVKDGEQFNADTYVARITDKFQDLTGYLIIARENKGLNEFRRDFGITDREFQIIDLVLAGKSNREIAENLNISVRTVETHRNNVYSKIGINDRFDLFMVAQEYNLTFRN